MSSGHWLTPAWSLKEFSRQQHSSDIFAGLSTRPQVSSRPLALGHLDITETVAHGFTQRLQAALDACAVELLETSAVDHESSHAWGHVPDVLEGDHGELAAPAGSNGDAAEEGHQLVAAALAAVEAHVGVLPYAVDGVGALGLTEDIVEFDLDVIVQVVGVSVDEVEVGHLESQGLLRAAACCEIKSWTD